MTFPIAFPISKTASSINYGGAMPDIRINAGANPLEYFLLDGSEFVLAPGDDFGLICDPGVMTCRNYPPCIRVPPCPPGSQVAIRNTATVNGDRLVMASAEALIIDTPLAVRTALAAFDSGAQLHYHVFQLAPAPGHPELSGKLIAIPLDRAPMSLLDPDDTDGAPVAQPRTAKPRKPAKPRVKAKATPKAKAKAAPKAKAKAAPKAKANPKAKPKAKAKAKPQAKARKPVKATKKPAKRRRK